jgi:cytochrome c peroxidase
VAPLAVLGWFLLAGAGPAAAQGERVGVQLGLPELRAPADNPSTRDKVALGRQLFFDTRLSAKGQFSCAVCHMPEKGWGDGQTVSTKADGSLNTRHSPTLFNIAYATDYYWDGRKPSLESTSEAAWINQMGAMPDVIAATLAEVPEYQRQFERVFGSGPTGAQIPQALGAFIRSEVQAGDTPWDRFLDGDDDAVSQQVIDGEKVFRDAQ